MDRVGAFGREGGCGGGEETHIHVEKIRFASKDIFRRFFGRAGRAFSSFRHFPMRV
jgi:hypothetical protein